MCPEVHARGNGSWNMYTTFILFQSLLEMQKHMRMM